MNNQCAVYPQVDEFSSTPLISRNIKLGTPINQPTLHRKPDFRSNIQPTDNQYLRFSVPNSQDSLNLRTQPRNEVSVFPRNIYALNPFAGSVSYFIQPRDKNLNYTFGLPEAHKERSEHPDWFSRYGYDRFGNEYGVGAGFNRYIEPYECHCDYPDVPDNVAPKRFYTKEHLDHTPTEAQKNIEKYRYVRVL